MGCTERYFDGPKQEITLKLPEMMLKRLKELSHADERSSATQELTYLLGCKMEALDIAIRQAQETQDRNKQLELLDKQLGLLWKALLAAQREQDLGGLLPELQELLTRRLELKAALDTLPATQETGIPYRWQSLTNS